MAITYNKIKATAGPGSDPQAIASQALANAANTVTRPGPLTTEWWTVLVAGAISAILGAVGLPGSSAAQVAAIAAPVILALAYAVVRAHTKGALAEALQALFPQAAGTTPAAAANGNGNAAAPRPAGTPLVASAAGPATAPATAPLTVPQAANDPAQPE